MIFLSSLVSPELLINIRISFLEIIPRSPWEASLAAREGAKKTFTMPAKKGRAKYVENAGIGHMDPGAFSTSEIISFVCNYIRIENEKTL